MKYKKCAKCGTANDDGLFICMKCGADLPKTVFKGDFSSLDEATKSAEANVVTTEPIKYAAEGMKVSETNAVAKALKVIAILTYLSGLILGCISGNEALMIWWITGAISGTFILGFSEVINLLQQIYDEK